MRTKTLAEGTERSFALIFETGEEVMEGLTEVATRHGITAGRFTAIGAFSESVLGYFSWEKKDYIRIPVSEQVEVVSLVGDIAIEKSKPKVHAHVVLGRQDASTCGGHLLTAYVRPTLEVIVTESPVMLQRVYDPTVGIALIKFD